MLSLASHPRGNMTQIPRVDLHCQPGDKFLSDFQIPAFRYIEFRYIEFRYIEFRYIEFRTLSLYFRFEDNFLSGSSNTAGGKW